MGSPLFWFDILVGALCIASALVRWWRSTRPGRHAVWSNWNSVAAGALGLCAWFSAIASLGRMAGLWYALVMACSLVAMCAFIIGVSRSPA
jgi:peptidoglycan/LPS O-acetylase OafA/YrhL